VALDLGTGDGRFVLSRAKREPERLVIGLDANVAGMVEASRRAPANALFARGAVEALPKELEGLADDVTVNFPWGSLFTKLLLPDGGAVRALRANCRDGARLTITTSIDPGRDAAMLPDFPGGAFDNSHFDALSEAYGGAGFTAVSCAELSAAEVRAAGSTWAKRLADGAGRHHWRLVFATRRVTAAGEPG
jgi:16S rRNA (adenine(1408)-N(1))-methyltransferase